MGAGPSKTPSAGAVSGRQPRTVSLQQAVVETPKVSVKGGYVKYECIDYVLRLLKMSSSCPSKMLLLPVLIGSRADPNNSDLSVMSHLHISVRTDWDIILSSDLLLQWLESNKSKVSKIVAVRKQKHATADSVEIADEKLHTAISESLFNENKTNFIPNLSFSVSCVYDNSSRLDFEVVDSEGSSGMQLMNILAERKDSRQGEFPGLDNNKCVIAPLSVLILIKQTHILFAKNWTRHMYTLQSLLQQQKDNLPTTIDKEEENKGKKNKKRSLSCLWDPTDSPWAELAAVRFAECCELYGQPPPEGGLLSLAAIYKVDKRVVEYLGLPLQLSQEEFESWEWQQQIDLMRSIMRRWVVNESALGRLEGLCTQAPCRWLAIFIINNYEELNKALPNKRPFAFDVDRAVLAVECINPLQVLPADFGLMFSQRCELPAEINLLLCHFVGRLDVLNCVNKRLHSFLSNPEVLRRIFIFRWPVLPLHALQQSSSKNIDWMGSFDLCSRLEECKDISPRSLSACLEATVQARAAIQHRCEWLAASFKAPGDGFVPHAEELSSAEELHRTCLIHAIDFHTASNPNRITIWISARFAGVFVEYRIVLMTGEMEDSRGHVWHENSFYYEKRLDPGSKSYSSISLPQHVKRTFEAVMLVLADHNNIRTSYTHHSKQTAT